MENKKETKFAEIMIVTNPENGEVTMCLKNFKGGPIVTGKNLAETKAKMKEAFAAAILVDSFISAENKEKKENMKQKLVDFNNEYKRLDQTFEHSI